MYSLFGQQNWIAPYGFMLVIAIVACWVYARRRAANIGIEVSFIDLAVPLIFLISALGAKFLAFIIPNDLHIAGDLYQAHFRFRLFGLLLVAFPMLFLFSRLAQQPFRVLLDVFALPAVLWLAILRVGCFMAGCCWGDLVHKPAEMADPGLTAQVHTLPWLSGDWVLTALRFPEGSLAYEQHYQLGLIGPAATESLAVHPTQLYEMGGLLVLLGILRQYDKTQRQSGKIALVTLAGYCLLRFPIEYLRADNALVFGMHTSTQVICVFLLLASYAALLYLKHNKTPLHTG